MCVSVCVYVCGVVTSIVRLSLTTGLLTDKRKSSTRGTHTRIRSRGVEDRGFLFVFPPSRYRLKRCGRSRSEHYAFRLQAAMGRAVMVGRGPTGAGVLVLSILIILTTESCRAQKGWWHTAAVTTAGADCNRSDMRPCCF